MNIRRSYLYNEVIMTTSDDVIDYIQKLHFPVHFPVVYFYSIARAAVPPMSIFSIELVPMSNSKSQFELENVISEFSR